MARMIGICAKVAAMAWRSGTGTYRLCRMFLVLHGACARLRETRVPYLCPLMTTHVLG